MQENTFIYSTGILGLSRKETAKTIAARFGTEAAYKGAPTFEYTVRDKAGRKWRIAKDGRFFTPELTREDLDSAEVFKDLSEAGARSEGAASVALPIAGHNGVTLRNLVNIIASKQVLVFKALGIDEKYTFKQEFVDYLNQVRVCTIENFLEIAGSFGGDEASPGLGFTQDSISFRWFPAALEPEYIKAYIQFAQALNRMALAQKHSTPRVTGGENEKYIFRVWLLRLGFIGDEYKTARKLFLDRLSGNGAFRTEEAMREALAKRKTRTGENAEDSLISCFQILSGR
ncbi:MAG: amidoligase family protein [Peptococcaceae bacterium]|jgi:hypothetical protein|nr:amidoligase family protein [Eubacteriales bacterium]MDH7526445.1 amidoligase family protein [Peptococcaceae bacterium]